MSVEIFKNIARRRFHPSKVKEEDGLLRYEDEEINLSLCGQKTEDIESQLEDEAEKLWTWNRRIEMVNLVNRELESIITHRIQLKNSESHLKLEKNVEIKGLFFEIPNIEVKKLKYIYNNYYLKLVHNQQEIYNVRLAKVTNILGQQNLQRIFRQSDTLEITCYPKLGKKLENIPDFHVVLWRYKHWGEGYPNGKVIFHEQ